MPLSAHSTVIRGSDHVETVVGDQIMMMSVAQGKYFALESTARRIWQLAESPTTIDTIVDQLITEYDVPRDVCLREVLVFVGDLVSNGLLQEQAGADHA